MVSPLLPAMARLLVILQLPMFIVPKALMMAPPWPSESVSLNPGAKSPPMAWLPEIVQPVTVIVNPAPSEQNAPAWPEVFAPPVDRLFRKELLVTTAVEG